MFGYVYLCAYTLIHRFKHSLSNLNTNDFSTLPQQKSNSRWKLCEQPNSGNSVRNEHVEHTLYDSGVRRFIYVPIDIDTDIDMQSTFCVQNTLNIILSSFFCRLCDLLYVNCVRVFFFSYHILKVDECESMVVVVVFYYVSMSIAKRHFVRIHTHTHFILPHF